MNLCIKAKGKGHEGMWGECHAHIFMNGRDYRQAVEEHRQTPHEAGIRRVLETYQRAGVTFIRDGGDHFGVSRLARDIAEEYGIGLLTPVFAIHKAGSYGKVVGRSFETMREYTSLVRQVAEAGGNFIKIMTSGIMDFKTDHTLTGQALEAWEVREMVHIAHEEGFRVMSHTNGARAVEAAVEAGVDSLEHGYFQDAMSLDCLAHSSTVWVPTLVTVRNLVGKGRFSDEVLRSICLQQKRNIRKHAEAGGLLALGSDAGAYGVLHGKGIREEYQAFQDIFLKDREKDSTDGRACGEKAEETKEGAKPWSSSALDAMLKAGEARIRAFL